jgi:hypothetical protein
MILRVLYCSDDMVWFVFRFITSNDFTSFCTALAINHTTSPEQYKTRKIIWSNKAENKTYHIVRTVPKSTRNIIETKANLTHIMFLA